MLACSITDLLKEVEAALGALQRHLSEQLSKVEMQAKEYGGGEKVVRLISLRLAKTGHGLGIAKGTISECEPFERWVDFAARIASQSIESMVHLVIFIASATREAFNISVTSVHSQRDFFAVMRVYERDAMALLQYTLECLEAISGRSQQVFFARKPEDISLQSVIDPWLFPSSPKMYLVVQEWSDPHCTNALALTPGREIQLLESLGMGWIVARDGHYVGLIPGDVLERGLIEEIPWISTPRNDSLAVD